MLKRSVFVCVYVCVCQYTCQPEFAVAEITAKVFTANMPHYDSLASTLLSPP